MSVNVFTELARRPSGAAWEDQRVAGDLVLVLTTPSIPEGEIAKGRLEAEGIPVFLKGEVDGPYRFGPVRLFVQTEFEVQARLVLEAIADDEEALASEERSPSETGDLDGPDGSPGS